MKLKPESIDVDLYVENRRLTEKESKELSEFIEQIKLKKENKKKHKKAA